MSDRDDISLIFNIGLGFSLGIPMFWLLRSAYQNISLAFDMGMKAFMGLMGLGTGVYLFWKGFQNLRLQRLPSGIATSKVRSLAMGTVELSGTAATIDSLNDPIYGEPCVFYSILVSENTGNDWETIHEETSETHPFFLADDTGRVPVFPVGAELYLRDKVDTTSSFLGGSHEPIDIPITTYLEKLKGRKLGFSRDSLHIVANILRENEPVYVLGYAVPPEQPFSFMERKVPCPVIIRKNPGDLFIIADAKENSLVQRLGKKAWPAIARGFVLALPCALYLAWWLYTIHSALSRVL